jgi:hypothetical protein
MSPHRRPGWTLPNGHQVRSNMEAALCDFLTANNLAHEHWSGGFELEVGTGALRLYIPSLTLTGLKKDGAAVVIEPIDSVHPGSGVRRLQSLRRERGRDYFVIIVARQPLHPQVPQDAYDAIFPLEDFEPLLLFLHSLA